MMAPPRWLLAAAAAASLTALPLVSADRASIDWMDQVPVWQQNEVMRLVLTAPSGEAAPLTYSVYPLTQSSGVNGTEITRKAVRVSGNIVLAEPETFDQLNKSDTIAYLSCDRDDSDDLINNVMAMSKLRAILLYSQKGNCCGLMGANLPFDSIFTMGSAAEASETLNTTTTAEGIVRASIMGNWTQERADDGESQNGSNSAVAMSILYSITGLITLLFLVIIGTGAIRAHRYPERYGPRSGYGGRPRQSRAKGLARAVLETLPVIKFGDPTPAKLDPAFELEQQQSRSSPDPAARARLSAIPEEPRTPMNPKKEPPTPRPETIAETTTTTTTTAPAQGLGATNSTSNGAKQGPNDEHLGCSICTEDFTVGEDVRVLPCDHKFHPNCIDPWLINVSGTCPLCRLDLRPQSDRIADGSPDDHLQLAPPLSVEWTDADEGLGPNRERRRSRLLDLHRLRQATVEERIEILRRHRSQQQGPAAEGDSEEPGRRARLADRLRDRFRIRTLATRPANS
ncbi:hypothetical protein QBC47DRAFT_220971 [Echria macrotheca]|uniref:RING-type domain-containing protein n=1 Tax=Echria macrotheca TaxID=438768 RepID=A0AAJ0BD38_9PEZI|nr:hypothetical protein QBC47DRAFT_220971 [Echria macrotheca]